MSNKASGSKEDLTPDVEEDPSFVTVKQPWWPPSFGLAASLRFDSWASVDCGSAQQTLTGYMFLQPQRP